MSQSVVGKTKRCSRCGVERELEQFHQRNNRTNGRTSICRPCIKAAYHARPDTPAPTDGTRVCARCKVEKHVTEFPKYLKSPTGIHQQCKECARTKARLARVKDPEAWLEKRRQKMRNEDLKRGYGLNGEQYAALLASQGGGCAICGRTPEEEGRYLAVDHDGKCCVARKKSCGKCVRGILCGKCNIALGGFGDNPVLLQRAIEYLAAPPAKRAAS